MVALESMVPPPVKKNVREIVPVKVKGCRAPSETLQDEEVTFFFAIAIGKAYPTCGCDIFKPVRLLCFTRGRIDGFRSDQARARL